MNSRTNLYSIFFGAVMLIGCSGGESGGSSESDSAAQAADQVTLTENQYAAAAIRTGKVARKSLSTSFHANGKLDVPPQNLITLSAPMGGFVKSIRLLQGMKVAKGAALFTLENPEYIQLQQDYLQNVSRLRLAETELRRQEQLAAENVNAQKTLQQARAEFETADAMVKGLAARLRMIGIQPSKVSASGIQPSITIYAPQPGFVTEVNVSTGQYVGPNEAVVRLVNLEHLHVELFVFEKDLPAIRTGHKVSFTLPNESAERTGTVYLIGKEISAERTIRVHCHLDREDESLLPGMFVAATVFGDSVETDVLPQSAIADFQGEKFVFQALPGRNFKLVPVTTGVAQHDVIAVKFPEDFDRNNDIVVSDPYALLGMLKNSEED